MQIRTKLTLQFILLVAGILFFSHYFIYYKFREINENEFYNSLHSKSLMTAEMVLHDENTLKPLQPNEKTSGVTLPFRENIIIYNDRLEKVFAFNHDANPLSAASLRSIKAGAEYRFEQGKSNIIGFRHISKSGKEYVILAESVFSSEDLGHLRNILMVTFFIAIGIVACGGWFYAAQALSPVSRIVDQVDRILPTDLSARLKLKNQKDELSRLVKTFNRLLDRIQFAFKMQKSFISNVSHELKNPLSIIISQLEVSLDKAERSKEEYRSTLHSVLDDMRDLSGITEKLLQLARVYSEDTNIPFEEVRLDELMLQTRESLLRMHPEYHIVFDVEGVPETEAELCIKGNESLLRSAFLNLLDNGCKFSPDKRVSVKIFFNAAGNHRVEITDQGPGIPAKDLQLIFQPFYRSSENIHVRGSGIGLSLVESIMKIHRIILDVDSAQGKGTTFRLNFPAAA
ncbi:MAG: HAMP domain-containing sensor histidine kinase [Saprospiraceae bacterium]|nr:HAMP domain-containing sensor histidine kinase [Saprospiraceae bacterium]